MAKIIIRISTLVLIPSLLANPSFALALNTRHPSNVLLPPSLFTQQALVGRIVTAIFPGKNGRTAHENVYRFFKSFWKEAFAGGTISDHPYQFDVIRPDGPMPYLTQAAAPVLMSDGKGFTPRPRNRVLGLKGGRLSAKSSALFTELNKAFVDGGVAEDYASTAANALVRMRPGSLEKLVEWRVIDRRTCELILDKNSLPQELRGDLTRTLAESIVHYETQKFTRHQIQDVVQRFCPPRLFQQMLADTNVPRSFLANIIGGHADFDTWIYEQKPVVDQVAARLHGRTAIAWQIVIARGGPAALSWAIRAETIVADIAKSISCTEPESLPLPESIDDQTDQQEPTNTYLAWRIVTGYGLERSSQWVTEAQILVDSMYERVGGKANAWLIIVAQGLAETPYWVKLAEAVVKQIEGRVGGPAVAWQIVRYQGIENAVDYVDQAQPVVKTLEKMVGGPYLAWAIVRRHGLVNSLEWAEKAVPIVNKIEGRVGGRTMAWNIVIAYGIAYLPDREKSAAEKWVDDAEPIAHELSKDIRSKKEVWTILIGQGLKFALPWYAKAKLIVDGIAREVGSRTIAWRIVIGQGIPFAHAWFTDAQPMILELEGEVGGTYNAWMIVTRIQKEDLPTWITRARAVAEVLIPIMGAANAWRVIITQGESEAVAYAERVKPEVTKLEQQGSTTIEAWSHVIRHRVENPTPVDLNLDMTWLRRLIKSALQCVMSKPPELLITAIVSAIEPLMLGNVDFGWKSLGVASGFGEAHTGRSNGFKVFAAMWGLGVMYGYHASPMDFWHTYPIIAVAQFTVNLLFHYASKRYPNLFNPKIAQQYLRAA